MPSLINHSITTYTLSIKYNISVLGNESTNKIGAIVYKIAIRNALRIQFLNQDVYFNYLLHNK